MSPRPLAGSWPPYLALIQRRVLCLPEDHAEGDTLGVGGEDPVDGEAGLGHGDGDEAVGTGPHKQLPVTLPKAGNLIHCEGQFYPKKTNAERDLINVGKLI